MNDWLYLLLIPALLALVWFWPEPKSVRRGQSAKQHTDSNYHAVSIHPCSHACAAVRALRGKRFLTNEVMSLPISGCDEPRCQCTYKHYADRRAGEERRRASMVMHKHFSNDEQRRGGDRRHHAYP